MVKINDNPDSVEEATKESESSGTNKYAIRERNFSHFFDEKRKCVPKNIENLLLENGFSRDESPYYDGLYVRNYKSKKEVFLYDGGNMLLARIPKKKGIEYGLGKIKGYDEGKEFSLLEKWLVPTIWTADIMGPLVLAGRAIATECNFNCENILLTVLKSFFEGGVLGAALWRFSWYVHNKKTFKEGKEALEYISGDKFTKDYKSYI